MIPVTLLNCSVQSDVALDPGGAPGSALRGALYAALRIMYDTNQPAESRHDLSNNPVAWLLRLEDTETSGGKDVPRPFALRPPLVVEGHTMTFGLAFYGRARSAIPVVLTALPLMGKLGVGPRRDKFTLSAVNLVDPLTGDETMLINAQGETMAELPPAPSVEVYTRRAGLLAPDALTVEFLTPTRIIKGGNLCHKPLLRPWVQRLLERIRTISEVYTDEPVWVPFRDLLAVADRVKLVEDRTHWHDSWSGSRRDGIVKPLGGYVGMARYAGDLAPLLPYILLGQALQVGKNTVKGCGWYGVV